MRYVRAAAMQQDVEIEADDVDKNGTILGAWVWGPTAHHLYVSCNTPYSIVS